MNAALHDGLKEDLGQFGGAGAGEAGKRRKSSLRAKESTGCFIDRRRSRICRRSFRETDRTEDVESLDDFQIRL